MSETAEIHLFDHHAMATHFQVRIAGQDAEYAGQAARAALDVADGLEELLSRFRETSEVSQIARLEPGQRLRLSEPVFACLAIAREMEAATRGAFSVTAAARQTQPTMPRWSLDRATLSIGCEEGRLDLDLGAIGKGFALDRMAEELAEWDCPAYLLIAGGSSILAGEPPSGMPGWDSGVGDETASRRYWLAHGSLSGSGIAVKGLHILDPRTGKPATQRPRAWVFAPSAAESDALSTACMVLTEPEIAEIMTGRPDWLALWHEGGDWRSYGDRIPPETVAR
jgi:thiamine biosynthesis lipoprotein